jgi:hypothetical protein
MAMIINCVAIKKENFVTYLLSVHFDVGHIIFEDGRNVNLRELILTEDYEQTSFTTGPISNNDKFLPYSSHEF